jgi:hypothetical protein
VQILRTAKKDSYIGVKQLLLQAYEQSSGLFDYIKQARAELATVDSSVKRPLSSVAAQQGEDAFIYSKTFDTIKAFADSNVKEFYGINLQEFLQYPHVVCDYVLKDSQKRLIAKAKADGKIIQDIQNMQK